jgi:lipoate-protein ligase A
MRFLDVSLPTPAENLALDEALLETAEAADTPCETLRLWESDRPMVVVGRSSRLAEELRLEVCRQFGVPVLRRISGGAAVLAGPGCLMYALVLSLERRPELRAIDQTHRMVLGAMAAGLGDLVPGLTLRGICDLTLQGRKVSGNSVRVKRRHLLYHGTLLYGFPLDLIGQCLAMPPREPDYRGARPHGAFVANLPLAAEEIRRAVRAAWGAEEVCDDWPRALTQRLVRQRYGRPEWNEQW